MYYPALTIVIIFLFFKLFKDIGRLEEEIKSIKRGNIKRTTKPEYAQNAAKALPNNALYYMKAKEYAENQQTTDSTIEAKEDQAPVKIQASTQNHTDKTSSDTPNINLTTWIASISAILGVFFLVKYSIEAGLFDPKLRLFLTSLFGFAMILSGIIIHKKTDIANNKNIAQAFMGVGIASLYFVSYALSRIYGYVDNSTSFALMCLVTIISLPLAIYHQGVSIAMLGLIGGMLTPALTSDGAGNIIYFSSYLLVLSSTLIFISGKLRSFTLAATSLILTFAWMAYWTFYNYGYMHSIPLILVPVGMLILLNISTPRDIPEWNNLSIIATILSVIFGYVFLLRTGFSSLEWALVGLLTLSIIILTYFKPKDYTKILWTILSIDTLLCISNINLYSNDLIILTISSIIIVPTYWGIFSKRSDVFTPIFCVFTPLFYIISTFYIYDKTYQSLSPYFGLLITGVIYFTATKIKDQQKRSFLFLSGLLTLTSAFITYNSTSSFLSALFSAEIILISLLRNRTNLSFLNSVIFIISFILIYLNIDTNIEAVRFFISNGASLSSLHSIDILCQIIIPALAFIILGLSSKDKQAKFLVEGLGVALILYGLCSLMFDKATFLVHAGITNLMLISGLALCYIKKEKSSYTLLALGTWRLIIGSMVLSSPFFVRHQTNLEIIIFAYGLPMLIGIFINYLYNNKYLCWITAGISAFFAYTFIAQIFHPTGLSTIYSRTTSEIYSYSVGMLILIFSWFSASFYRPYMIKPTFALMYLTAFKVFFYDTSALEGFLKSLSFFGLAIVLFGISYLYGKYGKKLLPTEIDIPKDNN